MILGWSVSTSGSELRCDDNALLDIQIMRQLRDLCGTAKREKPEPT